MGNVSLVWFRNDLRLADNLALVAAAQRDGPVVPVYIWDPASEGASAPGAASRWWLHQSLASLDDSLRRAGSRLIIRKGDTRQQLDQLIKETSARAIFWNRRYEPWVHRRDEELAKTFRADGLEVETFQGALLHEPWATANKSGKPFQVFSAFWRNCLAKTSAAEPLAAPRIIGSPKKWPTFGQLSSLELEPRIDWAKDIRRHWHAGEPGAQARLDEFLKTRFTDYTEKRNRPDFAGTSELSPHLHFGEITPRQILHALSRRAGKSAWQNSQFVTELGWREFAYHSLFHFPEMPTRPLRPQFERFRWRNDDEALRQWQRGQTGYPIVDAGMRQLWRIGWMHNRVRMIVASFLVKDLLQPWQSGERWFWDTLVDADAANNAMGWQWVTGSGADAAPFFRIFNPVTQGEKFDPDGDYVRRWVPELAQLPTKWIHKPSEAPADVLSKADVVIGTNYPAPIINHKIAREVALEAYQKIQRSA